MMPSSIFIRYLPASASGVPVPRAACCCSTPYRQNSLSQALVLAPRITAVGVDLCAVGSSMLQSSAIPGKPAEVKFP